MVSLYEHEEIHCAMSLEIVHKMRNIINAGSDDLTQCKKNLSKVHDLTETIRDVNYRFDKITNHGMYPNKSSYNSSFYQKVQNRRKHNNTRKSDGRLRATITQEQQLVIMALAWGCFCNGCDKAICYFLDVVGCTKLCHQ